MLARLIRAAASLHGKLAKFCLVADGKADIYLQDLPTMEWDTAAAQCIVEATGEACTRWMASRYVTANLAKRTQRS
jgi:3'-phosphoadenosine 5'-phosphosulfate (PAPS) 3'-phosphatase